MKHSWFSRSRREAPRRPGDLQATVEAARLAVVWLGPDLPLEPGSYARPANVATRDTAGCRIADAGWLAALTLAAVLVGCGETPAAAERARYPGVVSIRATTDGVVRTPRVVPGEAVVSGEVLMEIELPPLASIVDIATAELSRLTIQREIQERQKAQAQMSLERGYASPELVAFWENEIAQTGQRIASFELALASARARWTARVTAPMAGCVSEQFAAPGEWVREGDVLLRLAPSCTLALRAEGFDDPVGHEAYEWRQRSEVTRSLVDF
jgi:biotin carboxyl carrier protein